MPQPRPAAEPFVELMTPKARTDPYPLYAEIAACGPVAAGPEGLLLVTSHELCNQLLRDPRMSSDERNSRAFQKLREAGFVSDEDLDAMARRPFLFADPPDHTRLRRLVTKAFTPRRIARLRPRIVALTDELLPAPGAGTFELVEDLAYPLPITVISELLGVPEADRGQLQEWSRPLGQALDPPWAIPPERMELINAASLQLMGYLEELIERRRREPSDDLLSGLVAVEESGDQLSTTDIIQTCLLLLIAGHETTVNLLSSATHELLAHPGERARLADDEGYGRAVVEEALRFDPPVQFRTRVALEPVQAGATEIPAGAVVMLLLAAGNRDPAAYADPGTFRPDRYVGPDVAPAHLAFGGGIHYCLGAALARLEGEVALHAVARRLDGARVAGPPVHRPGAALRGLAELRLELVA